MKQLVVFLIFINILNATSFQEANNVHKNQGALKAIPLYKELAKQNNTKALNTLAIIFIQGDGVKKDIKRAYKLLKKSENLNSSQAKYLLGKIYQSKKSPYYNKIKAYNSFVDSANEGYAKSQTMIGKYLLFGKLVDKDYEKALYYFKKASKQKEYSSNCYIAYMYASGSGVFPNFGRAHQFAKDQYRLGNKLCQKVWKDYNLGKYKKDGGWKIGDYNKPVK